MTYCVAMLLDADIVCLSDSHTNTGVDQINTFRKTTAFERSGERVGGALREMHHRDAGSLRVQGVEFDASFILGGQIRGEAPRPFHIYWAGNFVEARADTTYFQIAMDSTVRSKLSVGLPLDLVTRPAGPAAEPTAEPQISSRAGIGRRTERWTGPCRYHARVFGPGSDP